MQLNYGAKCVIPKKISPHLAFFYHVEIMHSTQMKLFSNSIVLGKFDNYCKVCNDLKQLKSHGKVKGYAS